MSMEQLTEFLGWCTVINLVLLAFTGLCLMTLKNWMAKIHSGVFGIKPEEARNLYFQSLVVYKVAFLMFNFVPYVALKMMA